MKTYTSFRFLAMILAIMAIVPGNAYAGSGREASDGPASTILFSDNFNDGNADGWTTHGDGTWSVVNGTYVVDMGQGTNLFGVAAAGDPNWTDYELRLVYRGEAGVDRVMYFRYQDDANNYSVDIRSDPFSDLLLGKNENGQAINFADIPLSTVNGSWYALRIRIVGQHMNVWLNSAPVASYDDTGSTLTHGEIALVGYTGGWGSDKIRFDNVMVAAP